MSWLKEYVEIECSPEEYASALTMSGSKVEGIENVGEDIQNVVVGKIISIDRHPDADKLVVCQVDAGDGQVQIVTGATNVNAGDYIPVALSGATLPGGFRIKKNKTAWCRIQRYDVFHRRTGINKRGLSRCPGRWYLDFGWGVSCWKRC